MLNANICSRNKMAIFVRAGWLIPSDRFIHWWNNNHTAHTASLPKITRHGESGAATLYKYLLSTLSSSPSPSESASSSSSIEDEDGGYDVYTLSVGPIYRQTLYVLVMTHAGIFDVRLEDVAYLKCGDPRRAQRVKRVLERGGLDFEENGVRFYMLPVQIV